MPFTFRLHLRLLYALARAAAHTSRTIVFIFSSRARSDLPLFQPLEIIFWSLFCSDESITNEQPAIKKEVELLTDDLQAMCMHEHGKIKASNNPYLHHKSIKAHYPESKISAHSAFQYFPESTVGDNNESDVAAPNEGEKAYTLLLSKRMGLKMLQGMQEMQEGTLLRTVFDFDATYRDHEGCLLEDAIEAPILWDACENNTTLDFMHHHNDK